MTPPEGSGGIPTEAAAAPLSERGGDPDITEPRSPPGSARAGRTRASWSPQRLTARGLYPRSGGAKRHQTRPLQLPEHKSPPGVCKRQGSPKPVPPCGGLAPQARRQAVLMQRFPPPTKEAASGRRTRGRGGRGPGLQPGPRLVPRQPRPKKTQPFSGVAAPRRRAGLRTSGWREGAALTSGRPSRGRRPPATAGGQSGRAASARPQFDPSA